MGRTLNSGRRRGGGRNSVDNDRDKIALGGSEKGVLADGGPVRNDWIQRGDGNQKEWA